MNKLHSSWTVYAITTEAISKQEHENPDSEQAYLERISKVTTFKTAEEFWVWYNRTKNPTILPQKTEISVFREGIVPLWESTDNIYGGKLFFRIPKSQAPLLWETLLLNMVGEKLLDNPNLINGIVLSIRHRHFYFAIWTAVSEPKVIIQLEKSLRKFITASNRHFSFRNHSQSLKQLHEGSDSLDTTSSPTIPHKTPVSSTES